MAGKPWWRVKARRSACLAAGALLLHALCAEAAGRREPRMDASDDFLTNAPIPTLRIEIDHTNLTALRRNDREYVRATVREGHTVYTNVGIHNKGAAGSRRDIDDRPALTLNFNKFQKGQRFQKLDKIHLNNSVQDPSYMTEILCGELFRAAGVPASRGTHARVFLNGRDLGFYVLKEGFDKTFLRRYFKQVHGNLYDGGFLREITEPLEHTSGEGDVPKYSDLRAVAEAAEERDPNRRLERLEKVLDLDRFISFIAMEMMTWHWDGYAMKRNNYRVYHDPESGQVVFLPHGMDQMFWDARGTLHPGFEGLVARQLVAAPEGNRRYRARLAELTERLFQVEALTNRLHQLQARIRPELEKISRDAAREHDGAVNNLRLQIIARARFLEEEMGRPEAKPLRFDATGSARLTDWAPIRLKNKAGETTKAMLDRPTLPDGRKTLHIATGPDGRCVDAWRTRLLLPPGQYRFEARARTAGVVRLVESLQEGQTLKGEGAGLRLSRAPETRPNKLLGDSPWQTLEYDFEVSDEHREIELVCELRAAQGEAWFELDSLRLRKR